MRHKQPHTDMQQHLELTNAKQKWKEKKKRKKSNDLNKKICASTEFELLAESRYHWLQTLTSFKVWKQIMVHRKQYD